MSDFDELIDAAYHLPDGAAKLAVLDEAVRDADRRRDTADGYDARQKLLDAAIRAGRGDLILTHFAWCLAAFDADPDAFDEYQILWRYKWVVGRAERFPEIALAQVHALIDDMAARFERYGAGRRAVASARYWLARHTGDPAADELYQVFRDTPRDHMSNCVACEADAAVDHHIYRGRYEEAYDESASIRAGWQTCLTVPERTYAKLLLPLLRLGRLDEAARLHRAGYRLAVKAAEALTSIGRHLEFLALTGNHAAGLRALERSLPTGFAAAEALTRYEYLRGAAFLLESAVLAGVGSRIKLPATHTLATSKATAADLHPWAAAEAAGLAAAFDARNGTSSFADELAATQDQHALAVDYPLTNRPAS